MLVRSPIQSGQRFPHHVELGLAVALEHCRVALPKHLRNKMIRHPTGAKPRSEGVP